MNLATRGASTQRATGTASSVGADIASDRPCWLSLVWDRHAALIVAVTATVWVAGLTFPLILHVDTAIWGRPGDATGTIGVYWWWSYALTHSRSLFDFPWGAPLGSGYELVPFTPVQVALSAPLSALVGPTAAYNIEVLSGFPLTAWVTFLLARQLGLAALAAAFSAFAFTFMPYHLEKAFGGHLGMVHLELFSATLLFLERWRQTGMRLNLIGAGVMAGLALGTDPYDGFIVAVMVAGFFSASAILKEQRRPHLISRLRANVLAAASVALVAGVFLPIVLLAAHRPSSNYQQELAATVAVASRDNHETLIYSARLKEYFLPWHANPLTPGRVRQYELDHLHLSNFTENTLTLGYTVIGLTIVGLMFGRRLFPIALGIVVGALGLLLAQDPIPHHVLPGITIATPAHYLFPHLTFIRVYARFAILVMLAASLLAGLGFAVLMMLARSGRSRALLFVPFLLLALEFNSVSELPTTQLFPAPAAYSWLRSQAPGILIEYPLRAGIPAAQEIQLRQYMLYQQVHQHPMFNGALSVSQAGRLEPDLEPYYSPHTVARLQALAIRYVFVHRADYTADGLGTPRAVPGLVFVTNMGDVDIFEVADVGASKSA
jgi:hypothetical protein